MPHHDDFDDGPPDLHDFLTGLARKASQPGGAQASGPDVPPPPLPRLPTRWIARIVQVLVAAAVVVATVLGIRNGVHLPGDGNARPRGIAEMPPKQAVLYAQREVRVHEGAGREFAVVDTLSPGESVRAGERASNGWVRIFDSNGHALGYAYRSDENFGPRPPTASRPVPGADKEARRAPVEPGTGRPATALCNDGSYWYYPTRPGSCTGRHGVKDWLAPADSSAAGMQP